MERPVGLVAVASAQTRVTSEFSGPFRRSEVNSVGSVPAGDPASSTQNTTAQQSEFERHREGEEEKTLLLMYGRQKMTRQKVRSEVYKQISKQTDRFWAVFEKGSK